MRHIILIDPLEKLTIKKDSTLMFARALQEIGEEVFLLFKEDFFISTKQFKLSVSTPEFILNENEISSINKEPKKLVLNGGDIIHMRLEPPFDTSYLRFLWMLKFTQSKGVKVINDPCGIMNFQEKLYTFESDSSIPSSVVGSYSQCESFFDSFKDQDTFIIKPLDLFQGYGVTKVNKTSFAKSSFNKLISSFGGLAIVQPFLSQIHEGEIRAIYFNGVEIGSILKTPPAESILANIAQGASYERVNLITSVREKCEKLSKVLTSRGVPWVAFDILDGKVSEANTTCPGLLYEVSKAYEENLSLKIAKMII